MKAAFLPIWKPAPPRPRRPDASISAITASGAHRQRPGERLVPAAAPVHVDRVQARLVDVLEQELHDGPRASSSATGRRAQLLVLAAPAAPGLDVVDDHLGVRRSSGPT